MSSTVVTPGKPDDGRLAMPRLPFPLSPLGPFVDLVASAKLSMYSKSLIGFLFGALLLLIMGALSLLVLNQMNNRVEDLSLAQEKMDLARQMKNDVTSQMHFRAMALLTGDEANNTKIANAKVAFSEHLDRFKAVDPQTTVVSFDRLVETSEKFDAASQTTLELYETGDTDQTMALHLGEEHPISHELEAAARLLIESSDLEWAEANAAFDSNRDLLTTIVWVFSALSIAAAIFLGLVISWSYIRPIRMVGAALSRVAAGDFSQRVEVSNRDELGSLASDVNSMSQQLDILYLDLEEANRKIVASEKLAAIGQLSGGIAHDLRNPLGVIRNSLYLLKQAVPTDVNLDANVKIGRNLARIDEQVDRAERTIDELMDYTGGHNIHSEPTDLNELIRYSLAGLSVEDGIEVVQDLDSTTPMVNLDRDKIHRVVVNLAINAGESMPQGGRLTVTASTANGFAAIAVSDTGIGIKEEDIEKIFQPLFTTKPGGTGFGLAACKEIVDGHGGTINVSQRDDGVSGTVFTVRLPIAG